MNELFSKIQPKLDENRNWDYSNYMTEHFPRRISGMGDDRRASEWIVEKFRSFGLEAEIAEYTAYNSNPVGSFVKVLEPETVTLESRPCCHISSTPLEGVELELLYLGAGDYRDYEGKDVRGKAVLVEVSYSPLRQRRQGSPMSMAPRRWCARTGARTERRSRTISADAV